MLSRGYTLQQVEGIRKSHRGRPEAWVQPRPVLAVLVPAGGGPGRKAGKVQRSKVNGSLEGGARLTVEGEWVGVWSLWCGHSQRAGISRCAGTPGRSWVLVPLLRRRSRTAIIVDWAPQMRESDRPTDRHSCNCTAPHRTQPSPGTGPRTNLKGIGSLHSCYIRRRTSLSRSTDPPVPTVGSCPRPSLPLTIRAAQCELPPPLACATQSIDRYLGGDVSTSYAHMDSFLTRLPIHRFLDTHAALPFLDPTEEAVPPGALCLPR